MSAFAVHTCRFALMCMTTILIAGCQSPGSDTTTTAAPKPEPIPTAPTADLPAIRGLWITRWDYQTPGDVVEAIDRA